MVTKSFESAKLTPLLVTPRVDSVGLPQSHPLKLNLKCETVVTSGHTAPMDSVGLPHNHPLHSGRDCGAVVTFGHTTHGVCGASTLPPFPIGLRLRNCRHVWPRRPWTLWGFRAAALFQSGRGCEAVVTFEPRRQWTPWGSRLSHLGRVHALRAGHVAEDHR